MSGAPPTTTVVDLLRRTTDLHLTDGILVHVCDASHDGIHGHGCSRIDPLHYSYAYLSATCTGGMRQCVALNFPVVPCATPACTSTRSRDEPSMYHPPTLCQDPRHVHPMVTCHAAEVLWPMDRLVLSMTASPSVFSPVPLSAHRALTDPHLCHPMQNEYEALLANHTWDLLPRPTHGNILTGKWVFSLHPQEAR